jgi:hypothetical protein
MQKFIIFGILSLLSLSLAPARGEFRKIPVSKTEACFFQLSRSKKIPHHCILWVDETAKLPFWKRSLGFQFGRLSRSQWQALAHAYAAWHNADLLAPYSAQHSYALIDFMPPTLQALDRHRFYAQTQPIVGLLPPSTQVQLVANCWGTVYEVLRLAHKPQAESPVLFAAAAQPMLETLRAISTPAADQKPGDILLLSHRHGDREYLDHVVLVIDHYLFFEKAGTGDEVPYRFVSTQTLTQIWNPTIFRYEVRRPLTQQRLPSPSDRFSLKQQTPLRLPLLGWERWRLGAKLSRLTAIESVDEPPTFLWIQPLPPLQQTQGRFQLPPAAYRADTLWPNQF